MNGLSFTAIDVETANRSAHSICQIGCVRFENGVNVGEWSTLIDPGDSFDAVNIGIHGIDEAAVRGAPSFGHIRYTLEDFIQGPLVAHSHFDKGALTKAYRLERCDPPEWEWLDTVRIARKVWPKPEVLNHKLNTLCDHIGFDFQHHDALEDARACAQILIHCCKLTGQFPHEILATKTKK